MPTVDSAAFAERLTPGGSGGVVTGLAATSALLVLLPVNPVLALVGAVVVVTAGIVLGRTTAPRVEVRDGELRAGRARIPVALLGQPAALDATQTRSALGPELDARAYVCLRGWIRTAVLVPMADPRDPTPYWFVSSRRPAELVDAIVAAQRGPGTSGAPGPEVGD